MSWIYPFCLFETIPHCLPSEPRSYFEEAFSAEEDFVLLVSDRGRDFFLLFLVPYFLSTNTINLEFRVDTLDPGV